MGLFDYFRKTDETVTQRTPITPQEVREMSPDLPFVREFVCTGRYCNSGPNAKENKSKLVVRSRDPHRDGPSNYNVNANGHATVPPTSLTWNGLAEERGWKTDPVQCPACQRKMARTEYKQLKRAGKV